MAYNVRHKGDDILNMFSVRLKAMRKDRKETQEDIARLLKVQRTTVGEYERGKIVPPIDKIKILADHFEVSVDYLMGNTNFRTHEERQERDALDISKNLKAILDDLENQQAVLTFDGEVLDQDSRDILISNIQNGLKMANIINDRKQS